jgi:thiosulfate/3-mercaptopyruvate sulfurtransferase
MAAPYSTLIQPEDLQPRLNAPDWVVFDCRHALLDKALGARVYGESHLPGARFADMERDLSGPVTPESGRHPLPDLDAFSGWLRTMGVTAGAQVVAYDDSQGMMASRLWWMLRYLGHDAVAVLDGGFARWRDEGRPLTPDIPVAIAGDFRPRIRSGWQADLAEVARLVRGQPGREQPGMLVDARGAERFRGDSEPIDPKAGHIPGAVNVPCAANVDGSGRFLPAAALRQRFQQALGFVPPRESVHYCGSGVSACHNLLAMAVAELEPGRLYVGSWSQWCKDDARPIATGSRP